MKQLRLTILSLSIMIGFSACGTAQAPSEETATKTIRALGVDLEWQSDVDAEKTWQDANAYCVQKGMRLPSPREFFALLDTNQSIDALFPSSIKEFWTSASFDEDRAWKITTWSSSQSYHDKNQTLGVRCLRGEQLSTHNYTPETDAFKDSNEKTEEVKLWQDTNDNSINRLTFSQAKNYCQAKGMRLPTLFELQQILDASVKHITTNDFLAYWSSTPLPTDADSQMTVNFTTGGVQFSDKEANNHLRCLKTLDTSAPVITLQGADKITLAQHTPYIEAGATAVDDTDGDVNVLISGSVEIDKVGTYILTYSATDSANNSASLTREITIVDETVPTLTLNGAYILSLNQGEVYNEQGATAVDNVDGTLTVTTIGTVDTSTPGTYTLTYQAEDAAGNKVSATRKITVLDVVAPIITLNGSSSITINQYDNYSDAGASAVDNVDGVVVTVSVTGQVDSATVGTYTITYTAKDSANNIATPIVRTITVLDTTPPTITLNGSNPQIISRGDTYNELSATASDNVALAGAIMIDTSALNISVVGNYDVTYTVSDTSGHNTTITRVVSVVDTTNPIIALQGSSPQTMEVHTSYNELGATAIDDTDGDISASIMIDTSAINTQILGDYTITYNVKDSNNNDAIEVTRVLKVVDTTAPILSLKGSANITINQNETYVDAGVTASDNYDTNVTLTIDNTVNTAIVNSYTITYTATDSSGNHTILTRTVNVKDNTKPVITLGGDNPLHLAVHSTYNEPGAIANDAVDGAVNVTITGDVNTTLLATYILTYSATDSAGNSESVTREVIVEDTVKPEINITGNSTINIEVHATYTDAGATVTDNYDTSLQVSTTGNVNTDSIGTYYLYYDVNDSSGNSATQVKRTINVLDTTPPTITLIGNSTVYVEVGSSYTDAGATARDNYDGDISNIVAIVNPVNENSVNTYTVTFNVSDAAGNTATEVTRTVIVQDTSNQTSAFTAHVVTTNAKNSEWLEMVDLDKDGDLDILSASTGNNGAEVAWYENHGNYSFTEHIIAIDVNKPESVKAADMDNDGDLDILYTTYDGSGSSLKQCINDGSQTFSSCSDIANATGALSFIDIVDLDNDGKKDIVSASWGNNRIDWYKNDGNNTYTSPNLIDNANMTNAISLDHADFDKDGDMDIIAAANGENRVDWYENNGTGGFTSHFGNDTIKGIYSVQIADISNNGYLDIITTSNQNNKVYWHASSATSTPDLTTQNKVATLTNVYFASGVDIDNDGDIDILSNSSKTNGKIAWYENIGSATNFPEHIVASGVDNVIRSFAADIDNDGNMDIIAGDSKGNIIIYENDAATAITLLPKTGDVNDGSEGGDYSFSRDDSLEIVSDSLTGLMWQDDVNVTQNSKKWADLDLVNDCKINLGGYNDWRFPNRHELYYLAQKRDTVLDTSFQNISSFPKDYWTSSPNKIYVSFSSAYDKVAQSINFTRCVRGKPLTFDFIRDDNQNVVLDKKHNRMWEDGVDSDQKTSTTGWDDAKTACSTLDYLGYSDWRLPNIHELYSIFDDNGLVNAFQQRGNSSDILISSTTYNKSTDKAYGVNASNGLDEQLTKTDSLKFRCVRNISN